MTKPATDDVRSTDPVDRLLEDSWKTRSRSVSRREALVESVATVLFLACAVPLALSAPGAHPLNLPLAALLVGMYALTSSTIKFPLGAGYVVPSYLVLVPMLLLLAPGVVPLLAALGLVLGTLGQVAARRVGLERIVFSIPDAWHVLGPATVLVLAGPVHGSLDLTLLYLVAFSTGCLIDLISATVRDAAALGVAPRLQLRVIALVWLIDACIAPLGILVAHASAHRPAEVLLILPLNILVLLMSRDRNSRIEQAQHRLDVVARERTRLQAAVGRLGDAFAARLDMTALIEIVLQGSIEALDADAGVLTMRGGVEPQVIEIGVTSLLAPALQEASASADTEDRRCQVEHDGVWALGLPLGFSNGQSQAHGALVVARKERAFRVDEEALMRGLVERAQHAAREILATELLRLQALTDALTQLGNRRKLAADIDEQLVLASNSRPLVLMLFDLDGFKSYNDTFGHLAGDAVLTRLGAKLATAVAEQGTAYRLGGDEFCALIAAPIEEIHAVIAGAAAALEERGENVAVGASCGAVLLPHEATTLEHALQLADERMYTHKRGRPSQARDQTRDVLMRIMDAKQPSLHEHSSGVAQLALRVGHRLGMTAEELDELVRAADLHDIGKVGIPDAILSSPRALTDAEWESMHQHTVLGERILRAAPSLRPVAVIVRASHERWDGRGYPDRLGGERIPLGSRVIAACDAYEAMTTDRCYRQRMSHAAARDELQREAGHQFDPAVVEILLQELDGSQTSAASFPGVPRETHKQMADAVSARLREVLAQQALEQAPQPRRHERAPRAAGGFGSTARHVRGGMRRGA